MIEMLASIEGEDVKKLDEQITYLLHIRNMNEEFVSGAGLESQLMQLDGQSIN
jgi:hypothetical protein